MADRSVKVNLEANVQGFVSGMRTAQKATTDFAKRANDVGGRAFDWVDEHRASINDLSNSALGLGAGLLAGAGLATKAAIDWESAWTGVTKTVEGTDAQMANLEAGLRDMAKELPATHSEIASVAEAAGQLGIATPEIEGFTRTMIDLGETTNLSAEEAATALARFSNITGTSQGDIDKLGSTVVGLGNNFATTESEIVTMGQRLAGAGEQAGLSEGEILGMAAAMSSVGIEAEAGGSAMSQTMKRIGKSVDEGGESLDLFAQVSGMTSEEFATAWETRPAEAMTAFIEGLSRTEEMGMSTNGVLSELGITAIRESDALLRLSSAGELAADAMEQGNVEFEEGTALAEEAAKRYETAESKIRTMANAFVDLGIDLGGSIAPALSDAAENVSFLVDKFQGLPDAAKSALGMGIGVGGMALLAVGGLGKAVTMASDLRVAFKNLGVETQGLGRKMKLLGAASVAGLAIAGLTWAISEYINNAAEASARSEDLAGTLDEVTGAATAATEDTIIKQLGEQLDATDWDALDKIGLSQADLAAAVLEGGAAYEEAKAKLDEYALAQDGQVAAGQNAEDAYAKASEALTEQNGALEEGREKIKQNSEAQEELAGSTGRTAEQQQVLDAAIEETGVALDGTIEKMSDFLDLLFETGLATMSARDAQSQYHETIAGVDAAVEDITENMGGMGNALNDNKSDFDLTTEAGRTANGAFQDVAKSGMDLTKAMADNGASQEELQGSLRGTYDDLMTAAQGMGLSEDAAYDLTREILGIPDDVDIDTWMSDEAERQAEDTQRAISSIDRYISIVTQYTTRGTKPSNSRPTGAPVPIAANADGNVWESPGRVKAFANGAENHVAQIAAPGAMRLWAEPETGGEAYIPLAQSKRARSEAILADVANRFGMGLSKYADGGVRSPAYAPSYMGVQNGQAIDYGMLAAAIREGAESANLTATMTDRVAANYYNKGRKASASYGGNR